MSKQRLTSSFRDPAGFLFEQNSKLYRQINISYKSNYDLLVDSGLYQELAKAAMIKAIAIGIYFIKP